jgi:hypothetical protein
MGTHVATRRAASVYLVTIALIAMCVTALLWFSVV